MGEKSKRLKVTLCVWVAGGVEQGEEVQGLVDHGEEIENLLEDF